MISKYSIIQLVCIFLISSFNIQKAKGQSAAVKEGSKTMKTYPYSDPNPLPSFAINRKVAPFYPYYVFDGYTDEGTDQDWKIVELENPYIRVSILPEVGGKVMGAIEKSTGKEFVYLNHVMKFRAIGIRGPWTSGGIEHNFGLDLGHAPWAAAPVDYVIKENADGSVSCIVGGIDLASRTQWRVKIVLPKDKAYFETQSLWYNPTPLHDAYLSWENAAYKATNDLQFYFPGTHHIGHDGSAHPWPIDHKGRDLSFYKNNDFGGSKSYHVMGTYTNWFGGYWHDTDFGFGHWAPYSDAPGKKLWIWSLSRSGAIWEDLLTDSDGQYIEAQSGVKLNQAGGRSGYHSPFNQLSMRPFYTETKSELWFPVKATGGMTDASPDGTLHVTQAENNIKITLSPIAAIEDTLKVHVGDHTIYSEWLQLQPMQDFSKTITISNQSMQKDGIRVTVGNDLLVYSTANEKVIDRPMVSSVEQEPDAAERFFRLGEDENAMRNYAEALEYYMACLKKEPTHSASLTRMAELYYRKGQFAEGLKYVEKVLEENTYDGGANYLYGVLQRKLGRLTKAEEALSMAARTMEYRSGAYTQMAGIEIQNSDYSNASIYAMKALEYNTNNLMAYEFLGTSFRKLQNTDQAKKVFKTLLEIDPLNHYARFEQYLLDQSTENMSAFHAAIRNELPHETYLELAMEYVNQGLEEEAIMVLEQAPSYPTISYWLAYLHRHHLPKKSELYLDQAIKLSSDLVFPFRLETIPVLNWAQNQVPSWKNLYYLGLIYWSKQEIEKAKELFKKCGDSPDLAPFYITRGILFQGDSPQDEYVNQNFKKANEMNPNEWRTWHYLCNYTQGKEEFQQAASYAQKAYSLFPENPIIGMDYAKALLNIKDYQKTVEVLHEVQILPQEGAREGHDIYQLANLASALDEVEKGKYQKALQYLDESKKWPENLGAGMPYEPDTRLQDYIAAFCEVKLSNQQAAEHYHHKIATYSLDSENWSGSHTLNNYLGIQILHEAGKTEETSMLVQQWEISQDSLKKWNISTGTSSPEVKWVLAKYRNEEKAAKEYEEKLTSKSKLSYRDLFFRAVKQTLLVRTSD